MNAGVGTLGSLGSSGSTSRVEEGSLNKELDPADFRARMVEADDMVC